MTPPAIQHDTARRLVSCRLDAPLSPAKDDALTTHLDSCPTCHAFERRLVAGMAGLAAAPRVPSDPAAARAILDRIHAPRRVRWFGDGVKLAGALTAFALIGALLAAVLRPSGAPTPPQPAAGAGERTATLAPTAVTPATGANGQGTCDAAPPMLKTSVDGAAGTLYVGVTASRGYVSCARQGDVTLAITDATGQPLDMQGNGVSAPLEFAPGQTTRGVVFAWKNLCDAGGRGPFRLVTSAAGAASVAPQADGPLCVAPEQPATLAIMPGATPNDLGPVIPGSLEPACTASDVGVSLTFDPVAASGPLIVAGAWATRGACLLDAQASLTITGPGNGPGIAIANPMFTANLDRPAPIAVLSAIWTQPCPADGTWRLEATVAGQTAILSEESPPCDATAMTAALTFAPLDATPTATATATATP